MICGMVAVFRRLIAYGCRGRDVDSDNPEGRVSSCDAFRDDTAPTLRSGTDEGDPDRLSADKDHVVLLPRSIDSAIDSGTDDNDTGDAGVDRDSDIDEVDTDGELDREGDSKNALCRMGVIGAEAVSVPLGCPSSGGSVRT
jgi:hypothetical protein